jgi:hypothetical protein
MLSRWAARQAPRRTGAAHPCPSRSTRTPASRAGANEREHLDVAFPDALAFVVLIDVDRLDVHRFYAVQMTDGVEKGVDAGMVHQQPVGHKRHVSGK